MNVSKRINTKEKIIKNLIKQNCFWSYDTESIRANIDDSFLIEHALLYADVEDIFHLFLIFDKNYLSILILTEIVAWNKKIEERIRNAESKKTY